MADRVTQTSEGDNSPNVSNINNGIMVFTPGDEQPAGKEIHTIVALIKYLSENSDTIDLNAAEDYKKSFQEKLAQFPDVEQELAREYVDLATMYDSAYRKGWDAEDIGEAARKKIALYLQRRSTDLLNENNASAALPSLCSELRSRLPDNEYDEGAIRYFILSQFCECNVLPIK